MNIINYEILINESTMHVISYLVLFIAIIVIGGWLTDLCVTNTLINDRRKVVRNAAIDYYCRQHAMQQ